MLISLETHIRTFFQGGGGVFGGGGFVRINDR